MTVRNVTYLAFGGLVATLACTHSRLTHPAQAKDTLTAALAAAAPHTPHVWRDTPRHNDDHQTCGYIEIGKGDRDKRELRIDQNQLEVDRVIDVSVGGYPTNYGIVPQTHAYDSDPLDILVLGPRLDPGTVVCGTVLGVMHMEDQKGVDPKIVIAQPAPDGTPQYALTAAEQSRIGTWFDGYKKPEAHLGKWAKVTGWGDAKEAQEIIDATARYFDDGLRAAGSSAVP